jgi:hypothetical protein
MEVSMFNCTLPGFGSKSSLPAPPPPLPTPEDPAIKQRGKNVAAARKRQAGLAQTIKTPAAGVGDPTIQRKVLLGS